MSISRAKGLNKFHNTNYTPSDRQVMRLNQMTRLLLRHNLRNLQLIYLSATYDMHSLTYYLGLRYSLCIRTALKCMEENQLSSREENSGRNHFIPGLILDITSQPTCNRYRKFKTVTELRVGY